VAVVAATVLAVLVGTAAPAMAGTTYLGHSGGSNLTLTWRFSNATNLQLVFNLRDTKCNGHSAYGEVSIYGEHGLHISTVRFTNGAGCNTTRTYDTGLYSVFEPVINIRICTDGDGVGGIAMLCGSYQDNPYT
jgi:hypothetical protein